MSRMIRGCSRCATSAAAGMLVIACIMFAGCQSSPLVAHEREVVVYQSPNLGTADALGYLVFVLGPERAERQRGRQLMAEWEAAPVDPSQLDVGEALTAAE